MMSNLSAIRQSTNLYVYCMNNPGLYTDSHGLDAILINKLVDNIGNIVGTEHMSGFFQDENDNWWFFFWGDKVQYVEVDDASIFDSMDTMNQWLIDNGLVNPRYPYHDSVYIKGDFTASHNKALELLDAYTTSLNTWNGKGLPNKNYNVVTKNCGQVTMDLLMMGTLPNGTNVGTYIYSHKKGNSIIPNSNMNNMRELFCNKAINLTGFETMIQRQKNLYEGKSSFIQWFHSSLKRKIDEIS